MSGAIDYSLIADLYDSYVRTERDIPFFLQEASQVSGEILELMSGTGRVSIPLIKARVRLTCVDSSPEMLEILRKKLEASGLEADVHLADVRELNLGRKFELIFIPFHAFAELISPLDQRRTLQVIHQHLSDEGTFICTLHNPSVRLKRVDGQLHLLAAFPLRERPGKLLVWNLESYDQKRAMVDGVQLFEEYDEKGLMRARRLVDIHFRIIQKQEFENLARASGFGVISLIGDYSCSPFRESDSPFMIWKLQKNPC
jgi:SAM-dependent methyltransferase